MTESAQTRFFTALDALAEANGCEVVREQTYANTGRVALVKAGTFTETVSFSYHFSTGHNVFDHARLDGRPYRLGEGPNFDEPIFANAPPAGSNPRIDIAHNVAELQRVLDAVEAVLKQGVPA